MPNTILYKIGNKTGLIAFFCVIILLLVSFSLRQSELNKSTWAPSIGASWHVLLTATAMSENKVSDYWLLPTVTLGGERNKYIPWGDTVPTASGDYIYTSFTPLGFLLPHLWFEMFDLQPNIKNLAQFNFIIQLIATVSLYFLIIELLTWSGISLSIAQFSALGGVTIGIFSREALLSYGILYWHQSLYQIVLIFCIYFFFKLITLKDKSPSYILKGLVALTFLGAYLEWTGFVFAIFLSALFWLAPSNNKILNRRVARLILYSSIFAGLLILVHYSLAIGLYPTIYAYAHRFFARSSVHGNPIELLNGYWLSYGFYLPLIFGLLASRVLSNPPEKKQYQYELYLVFLVACCPLLENLLMLQHATEFSFDRLKFIIPASILIAFGVAYSGIKTKTLISVVLVLTCISGYRSYNDDLHKYSIWSDIDATNIALASKISEIINIDCAVIAGNIRIGYANLLFHRGIYERLKPESIGNLIKSTSACAGVYLKGSWTLSSLPTFTYAIIQNPDGSIKSISAK